MATPAQQAVSDQATRVAQEAAASLGGSYQSGVGFKAGPNTPAPALTFDATKLAGSTPFTLPPSTTTPNSAAGTGAFIKTSVLDTYKAQRDQEIKDMEKVQTEDRGVIKGIYDKIAGKGKREEEIYKDQGVDKKRAEVDEVTNQIEAEQVSLARRIEEIEKNPEGKLASGLRDEISRITRDSVRKQADLAIIQSAANRTYTTAAAIAQRQLDNEFEPLLTKLDSLKFFYQENRDDLTKKQDREYQELIQRDERAYQEQYDEKKALQDAKLKMLESASAQDAPVSVLQAIQLATTAEGAIAAAGKYGTDLLDRELKRAQIAATNRSNQPGGGGPGDVFTKSQLNTGAARLKIPLADFMKLDYETQNQVINAGGDIDDMYTAIESGTVTDADGNTVTDSSEIEGLISNSNSLLPAEKDSLVRYLYKVSKGK